MIAEICIALVCGLTVMNCTRTLGHEEHRLKLDRVERENDEGNMEVESEIMSWKPCSEIISKQGQGHQCLNGGRCQDLDEGPSCMCVEPYWGPRCEFDGFNPSHPRNPCFDDDLKPICKNNGRCKPESEAYNPLMGDNISGGGKELTFNGTCICPRNYIGRRCETEAASVRCEVGNCLNGNATIDQTSGACRCDCDEGWIGDDCDVQCRCGPDLEFEFPCMNSGQCNPGSSSGLMKCQYKCQCMRDLNTQKPLYEGEKCEQLAAFNPCIVNSTKNTCVQTNTLKCVPYFESNVGSDNVNDKTTIEPKAKEKAKKWFESIFSPDHELDQNRAVLCHCKDGFIGENCEIDAMAYNPCRNATESVKYSHCMLSEKPQVCLKQLEENPDEFDFCLNGGVCHKHPHFPWEMLCACPSSHYGRRCELDSPCFNNEANFCGNGTCIPIPEEKNGEFSDFQPYVCLCDADHSGPQCRVYVGHEKCKPNPCQNGGHCLSCPSSDAYWCPKIDDQQRGYRCICTGGWTGTHCSGHDYCAERNIPCYNNGVCIEDSTRLEPYRCLCPAGFNGTRCQTISDLCKARKPCIHGRCYLSRREPGYRCFCDSGYEGRECQLNTGRVIPDTLPPSWSPHLRFFFMLAIPTVLFTVALTFIEYRREKRRCDKLLKLYLPDTEQ